MQQTKPLFIIRKYRSILWAAVIVEAVNYIVSLTDSIISGNLIGSEALTAIGLIAPFLAVSTFVGSIVNSGTVMNYSYQIGRFEKQRALEYFSQGIFMALISGAGYALILLVLREQILSVITAPGEIREFARDYYNIILLFFLLNPVSYLLDNLLVADGGEKLSAGANIVLIVSNIGLSILFAVWWGIKGVAAASVLGKLLFISIVCTHFLSKNNTLRLLRHWSAADCVKIIRSGIVKASTYALEALTFFLVNLFALYFFSSDTLVLLIVVEKYLGLLTLFIGLSMAAQPLIGTLNGEKNTKALRFLMRTVCFDMLAAGSILTILTMAFAPLLVRAFGIHTEPLLSEGTIALRIVGATLVLHSIQVLFFIYYYLMDRQLLSFCICLFKNLISPLAMALLLSFLMKHQTGLWIGLAAAPVLSVLISSMVILQCSSRELFPFLLPVDHDHRIFIYDFDVGPETCADMSRTADEVLRSFPYSRKTRMLAGIFIEDMLMLSFDKNREKDGLHAECTIIAEPDGVRLILRDSGTVFDATDEDAFPDSFRQYVVANLMSVQENKAYLTTTGYNRNELYFADGPAVQTAEGFKA